MIRVVYTNEIDEQWIENASTWEAGPGLLVSLDAEEAKSRFLVEPGSTIRVHRPDGTHIDRIAKGVSPPGMGDGWAVALFLPNTKKHEIPAGSEIELPPFCIPLFPSPE